jgi:DNA-binding response OmpR family regulator
MVFSSPTTTPQILVLGSGLTAAMLGVFALEEYGFKATLADSAESAEAVFNSTETDLIVLDWELTQAHRVLQLLRQRVPSVPVIIIASTSLPQEVRASAAAVIRHSEVTESLISLLRIALPRTT